MKFSYNYIHIQYNNLYTNINYNNLQSLIKHLYNYKIAYLFILYECYCWKKYLEN